MPIRHISIRSVVEMGELFPFISDQADFLDWTSRDVQLLEQIMASARRTLAKENKIGGVVDDKKSPNLTCTACSQHVANTQCERMADVLFVCGEYPCIINGHKRAK